MRARWTAGRMAVYTAPSATSGDDHVWAADPATGEVRLLASPVGGGDQEANLSQAEKLRRERERNLATGITRYIAVPRAGESGGTLAGDRRCWW